MNKKLFVMDSEADGIYGNVLSIAVRVIDSSIIIDDFYGAVDVKNCDIEMDWVKENVLPHLKNAEKCYTNEAELLEAFWEFYLKYHGEYTVLCDVPFPVETGVFRKCIERDMKNREKFSPFPLLDLASMLEIKGCGALKDRRGFNGAQNTAHDAMNDVLNIIGIMEEI